MTKAEEKQLRIAFARSGGKARSQNMNKTQRSTAARTAAQARWAKAKQQKEKSK